MTEIRNETELREYTDILFALTEKERPTTEEDILINLLTRLIEDYEVRYYRMSKPMAKLVKSWKDSWAETVRANLSAGKAAERINNILKDKG